MPRAASTLSATPQGQKRSVQSAGSSQRQPSPLTPPERHHQPQKRVWYMAHLSARSARWSLFRPAPRHAQVSDRNLRDASCIIVSLSTNHLKPCESKSSAGPTASWSTSSNADSRPSSSTSTASRNLNALCLLARPSMPTTGAPASTTAASSTCAATPTS